MNPRIWTSAKCDSRTTLNKDDPGIADSRRSMKITAAQAKRFDEAMAGRSFSSHAPALPTAPAPASSTAPTCTPGAQP